MNQILLYFVTKYEGDWNKIFKALEDKERVSIKDIQEMEKKYEDKKWISILDHNYPRQFKEAYKPPFVLFYKGDLNLFKKNILAVSIDEIGKNDLVLIKKNFQEVSKRKVFVNSLQSKYDTILLKESQSLGRSNIIVSSMGLNFPTGATDKDLVITECPENASSSKEQANRLTAAASESLVLINSSEKNHSNLVTNFLNLGKEVYCLPKEEKNFNNVLIKQGANLTTSIKEIDQEQDIERER